MKRCSDLWVCSPRHREDGGSGDVLQRVSQVLRCADGGEMGLDGGVWVEALGVGVSDSLPGYGVGLVDGGAHRDDRYDSCCCDWGCDCCHSCWLHVGSAVKDATAGLWGPPAWTPVGPTASRGLPLLARAPAHWLLIQPIPLVSHLKQNLRIHTSTLGCFLYCHAGLLQHHIVLKAQMGQTWTNELP